MVFNVMYYSAPGPVQAGESSQFYSHAWPKITVPKYSLKGFTICTADSIIRSSIPWRYREPPYSVTAEPHRFFNMFETFYAFIKKLIVER